jgi:signal transduction histidine kinase
MSPSDRARERRLLNELSRINNDYATQQRRAVQDLARARQELAATQAVLGTVAHDLRTPLQSVLGFAEFLLDEDLDDRQRELALRIAGAASQMAGLADQLLESVASSAPDLRVDPVDVRVLVEEVVSRHRLLGPDRGIEVRADLPDAGARHAIVLGDEARLQRVLDNLVGNAVKFSPDGGAVTIGLSVSGGEVAIRVTDEGPGIEPAELTAVFEPVHRAPGAATVPGVGLGLTIVRQFVEQHGGAVDVRSSPGRGATFTVRLPALAD